VCVCAHARVAWLRASLPRCVNFLCTGRLCALSARVMQKNRHRDSENRQSCVCVWVCVCARACMRRSVSHLPRNVRKKPFESACICVCVCVACVATRVSPRDRQQGCYAGRSAAACDSMVHVGSCLRTLLRVVFRSPRPPRHHHAPRQPPPSPPPSPPSLTDHHHHRKPQVVLWDFNEAKCAETVDELNATSA
jgi:hypothetical protein